MTGSRTYRSQNVESMDLESMLLGREGQRCVVGVDVGKSKLYLVIRWANGEASSPVVVSQPSQIGVGIGFLQKLSAGRELRVAMEPSGTYGDVFRYACHRAGLSVERVSPQASNRHAEVYDGVPSQHDGKDAGVIAELCAIGKSASWPWREASGQEQLLSMHADLMGNYQQQVDAWRGRLEALLARHWPEASELLELDSRTLLEALIAYGSPEALGSDGGAAERLAEWGGRFLTPQKIQEVVQSARSTCGVPVGVGEERHLVEIATRLLEAKKRLSEHHRELEKLSGGLSAVRVAGEVLGKATMAVLHLAAGDPGNYSSGGAYLKALGLNLVERSSGQYVGRLHISKRGSPEARRWLYLSALRQLEDPAIERWYAAKVKRDGGRRGKAVTGVMRKLALGIYHCCRTGEVFKNEHVFQNRRSGRHRRRRRRMGALMAAMSLGKAERPNSLSTGDSKGVAVGDTAARATAQSDRGSPGGKKVNGDRRVPKSRPAVPPMPSGTTTATGAAAGAKSGTHPRRRSRR